MTTSIKTSSSQYIAVLYGKNNPIIIKKVKLSNYFVDFSPFQPNISAVNTKYNRIYESVAKTTIK